MSLKDTLKNKRYTIILAVILIFAFILRLKYISFQQPLWWDEAEYLSIAKHWAYGIPFEVSLIRPFLFSFLAAGFYKLGFGEAAFRILELLISLLSVFLTYVLGKKLFNPKVGLITSFIMSFFYLSLFYTARIMVDIPSMVLWMLTIYFFWEGFVEKKSHYNIWLMGLMMGLGYTLRFPSALVGAVLLIYLFVTEGLSFLKNKHLWIAALICFLTMTPYFIYFYTTFDKIPVIEGASYGFGQGKLKFDFYAAIIPTALQSSIPFLTPVWQIFQAFLLFFIYGLVVMILNLILGFDIIRKEPELKKYLLILLWLIIPFVFFSFIELAEDRYMFYIYPGIFLVIAFALTKTADYFKKYHKILPYAVIGLVLFSGAYTQMKYADSLINLKSNSYVQLKEAGLWLKANSNKDDKIISVATPQLTYYAERHIIPFAEEKNFEDQIKKLKPKYLVLTGLERSQDWTYSWPQNNPELVKPVHAYFFDAERKQPAVVIYEFVY